MTIQSTIHATHKEKSTLLNAANPRDLLPVSLTTFNTRTLYNRPGRSPEKVSDSTLKGGAWVALLA